MFLFSHSIIDIDASNEFCNILPQISHSGLPLSSYVSVRGCARRRGGRGIREVGGTRDNWREQLDQMRSRSCRWLNGLIKRLIYSHARCNVTLCEIHSPDLPYVPCGPQITATKSRDIKRITSTVLQKRENTSKRKEMRLALYLL